MTAFDIPVRPTVELLNRFSTELIEDLDTDAGGLKSWVGHTDGPRLALLADYLIQCVDGTAEALGNAALAAEEHREQLTADNTSLTQRQQRLASHSPSPDQVMAALFSRNEHETRRERRIETSAEHCLAHLVQALDRLSAVVVIVAAVKVPVMKKMGWPALARLAADADPKAKVFDAPTDDGVAFQRALIGLCQTWPDYGPPDWLPWLLETRNAMTHRGMSTKFLLSLSQPGGGFAGMLHAFYAQPSLSDMHSMSQTARTRKDFFGQHIIVRTSSDVLAGLVASTNDLVAAITVEVQGAWARRRENPALVIQPGKQWNLESGQALRFPGYGSSPRTDANTMRVGPPLAKRFAAAKVLDGNDDFWRTS